jgi:NAD(P)-dependent dehydrogenase (short-subunit alcohol dehydrogenase family)
LITGGNKGLGRETARRLVAEGHDVWLGARDSERGQATADELGARFLALDVTSDESVQAAASVLESEVGHLDVLVNNAGNVYSKRELTEDGIERTFALNHLAPFLLTHLLRPLLEASAPARVVNVSSGAQAMGRVDFEDLQGERSYSGQRAYNQSKLANVLFTYELARRLEGTGVTANALHPGVVRTGFGQEDSSTLFRVMLPVVRPFMLSPERGAETSVYLASSPEVEGVSGKYFVRNKARRSSAASYDAQVARRLWEVSAELTGVDAD